MKNVKTNRIDKEKLIEYYKINGSAVKTGLQFGLSGPTVLKIVRSYMIPVNRELKRYTDDEIITKFQKCGTVEKTGEELGMSDETIMKVLDRNNIERRKCKHIKIGDVFNKLTVIGIVDYKVTNGGKKKKVFLCKCECGGTRKVVTHKLTSTKKPIKDCGCSWKKIQETAELKRVEKVKKKKLLLEEIRKEKEERKLINKKSNRSKYKIGYKQERLTIISEILKEGSKFFVVQCDCGVIKEMNKKNFMSVKSCGCLQVEKSTIHGLARKNNNKWYNKWKGMIRRCTNPKSKAYHNYGGRGITVCDRWLEPNGVGCKNYIEDINNFLGPQPSSEHSLDRINNDGPYEINNLRWATNSEQVKNQRRNIKS